MKKTIIIILTLIFLAIPVYGQDRQLAWLSPGFLSGGGTSGPTGNDFSSDSNVYALYNFESGALTTDSKSTNTLTDINSVTANTSTYKQGSASADFEASSSQSFYRYDTDLSSGFPLKDGDTTKNISGCGWAWMESAPAEDEDMTLAAKYDLNGERSFKAGVYNDSGTVKAAMYLGYNGGADREEILHASGLSTATWYHICFCYQNSDKAYAIYVHDASGNVVGSHKTGTATLDANKLFVCDTRFRIGAYASSGTAIGHWDGLIDEMVIFNKFLTATEAAKIAQGIYP